MDNRHECSFGPLASAALLAVALIGWAGGCSQFDAQRALMPTQSDRLLASYPDLRSGRFAVIADFEDAGHMELVQLIGVSPSARCRLDRRRGRPQTGSACVRFTTASPHDTVVFNNAHARGWYLQRDWTPYDLLLLSVRAPMADIAVEVAIVAGPPEQRETVATALRLERGWNTLRLDLADIGEYLPLDDVQEIRLSATGASEPMELYFDDLILASNRHDLFGDSSNRDGRPYVRLAGRRWAVGAGGRFELTFAHGQIVRWHNLAVDPHRLHNLVEGTTMGPSLVSIELSPTEIADISPASEAVVVHARILETSTVHTVVACDWMSPGGGEVEGGRAPRQRRVYTIYPTGQMYVAVVGHNAERGAATRPVGLAVTLASMPEQQRRTGYAEGGGEDQGAGRVPYALSRTTTGDAALLYVASAAGGAPRMIEQIDAARDRASFVAVRDEKVDASTPWQCHIFVTSSAALSDEDASARAADYGTPARLELEVGTAVASKVGDGLASAFDPGSGCYVIAASEGRVRLVIDGSEQPRYTPAFKIINPHGQDAWVYVNHLLFDKVARDAEGNLVFQLPGTIRDATLVEVHFRRPSSFGAA